LTPHNPVTQIVLPVLVALVMFALGTSLSFEDLARVLRRPRGFVVGVVVHALLLPLLAFALAIGLGLPTTLAVGLVLIASCPAAAPASLFTHAARGDTMLCVCLTAAASLTSAATLPWFVNAALGRFSPDPAAAVRLPVLAASLSLFVVSTLPVLAGMLLRRRAPAAARAVEARIGIIGFGAVLFVLAAVIWSEKDNVLRALARAGGPALILNILAVSLAWAVAALAGLDRRQRIAVALECGLQNFAMAAFVALTLLAEPALLVPPFAYGLMCYLSAGVVIHLGRRAAADETASQPGPADGLGILNSPKRD
jgi:BASS family bile acid:Na+ symporter